jgi:hypothetical protein
LQRTYREELILIDYYNLPPVFRGKELEYKDHIEKIKLIIDKICLHYRNIHQNNTKITLRFYGGWYDEKAEPTIDRQCLVSVLKDCFPTVIEKNRYVFSFADGPLYSDIVLHGTVRIEQGLPVFSIKNTDTCNIDTCSLLGLLSWRQGRCPNTTQCKKTDTDFIFTKTQKIVDTLIVSDAIVYQNSTNNSCIIMSHDDDILPSILYGDRNRATILRPDRKKPSIYDFLISYGFQIKDI